MCPTNSQNGPHPGWLPEEVGQRIVVQDCEKRPRRFVQNALQLAGRQQPAKVVSVLSAVNDSVAFLAQPHDVTQPDCFRRASEREAAADPPLRGEITGPAKVMHNFDEMMP